MTVSTDLQTNTGSHLLGYLAIEGVEPLLFEHSDLGPPTGWTRSAKVCLDPPTSFANEVDLGEARPQISSATFSLQDIKESDGSSFFGKLFSTGRWTFNPHARMMNGVSYQSQINANAAFIPIKALGTLSNDSNGFITRESINWGDTTSTNLLNVTKGLYPPVSIDSTYGYTYKTPPDDGAGYLPHVGSVNFAMTGRRVAYYITTYDKTTGAFNSQANSELIWTGRISNEIQWDGEGTGAWKVACDSITYELSQKIPASMSIGSLKNINCNGPKGLKFVIYWHDSAGALRVYRIITITPGSYTTEGLLNHISAQMPLHHSHYWVDVSVPKEYPLVYLSKSYTNPGKYEFFGESGYDEGVGKVVIDPSFSGETCHALGALGFDQRKIIYIDVNEQKTNDVHHYVGKNIAESFPYLSYHPLSQRYNGGKLYIADSDIYWDNQGDASTSQACVQIEDTTLAPYWNLNDKSGNYLARYSSKVGKGATFLESNYLVLTTDPQKIQSDDGYVGQKANKKEKVEVQQVYIPHQKPNVNGTGSSRGPFELLLFPLLSTGTTGYNHATYDKCPVDLGLAVQKELIDIPSFLQADKYALAGSSGLGNRSLYVIDKPISWLELIQRECKLFGNILVWRKGKLRISPVLQSLAIDEWTDTLSDDTRADPEESYIVSMSTSTVVNQYECKLRYDVRQDKFGPPIIITDVDSKLSQGTKQIKIEHQGIGFGQHQLLNAQKVLESNLLERWIRFPLPVITVSLAPTYVNRIFAGDTIKFTSSLIPDPYGSGTMTTSTLATVLSSTWNYRDGVGECLLMLHDRNLASAWAPAALVDRTVAGGGLHNASNQIQLVPYTFTSNTSVFSDGNAVAEHAGWAVEIVERSPVNALSPNTFGPWNTVAAYFTANHCVQVPPDDFAGWDTTGNTEYLMLFSNFAVINTTQYDDGKGTWQAAPGTELLGGSNIAQVYK